MSCPEGGTNSYFSGSFGLSESYSGSLYKISLSLWSSGITVTPVYGTDSVALLFLEMISIGIFSPSSFSSFYFLISLGFLLTKLI